VGRVAARDQGDWRLVRLRGGWTFIASAVWLTGCAARDVTPVAMTQVGDDQLGCPALIEQLKANRLAADKFLREDKAVEAGNVAKGVTGAIFAPIGLLLILATTDLSNEEQIKARSLADRNEQLIFLARSKDCAAP
jgi:hypothetical protein